MLKQDSEQFPGSKVVSKNVQVLSENNKIQKYHPRSEIFWNSFHRSSNVIFIDKYFSVVELDKVFYELKENKLENHQLELAIICHENYEEVCEKNGERNKDIKANIH